MRQGDELIQALEWAYARLSTDQALADALGVTLADLDAQVWPDVAPADTTGVWVVITAATATDHARVGPGHRIWNGVSLDVQAVTEARAYDPLKGAAQAIYAALDGRTNDAIPEGGMMLHAQRVAAIQYPETTDGIEYRHLGHTFTVALN